MTRREGFGGILGGKRFLAVLSPHHGAKCDTGLAGGFSVADLITDIDGLLRFYATLAQDLPKLRRFAKDRSTAIEVMDQPGVFHSKNPLHVLAGIGAHDSHLNSGADEPAQNFIN